MRTILDTNEETATARALAICSIIQMVLTLIWLVLMILHYTPGLCPAIAAVDSFFIWLPLWIFPAADICCAVVLMILHALYSLLTGK